MQGTRTRGLLFISVSGKTLATKDNRRQDLKDARLCCHGSNWNSLLAGAQK